METRPQSAFVHESGVAIRCPATRNAHILYTAVAADDKEGKTHPEINIPIDIHFELDTVVFNYGNFFSYFDEHKATLIGLGNTRLLVVLNPQSNDSFTNADEMLLNRSQVRSNFT